MKIKVRYLTFQKRFSHSNNDSQSWWGVLGHTDEMEHSKLKEMSIEDIRQNNQQLLKSMDKQTAYHNVMYLILDDDKYESKDSKIWDPRSNEYLSVTRIHFPNAVNVSFQYNKIVEHIDNYHNDFKNNHKCEISYLFYRTTELSDMILVSSSASFNELAEWALSCTRTSRVGDAYTYFCIPGDFLKNNPLHASEDILEFASIRFSANNNDSLSKIEQIVETLNKEYVNASCIVSGNEDIIVCCSKIPMDKLLNFYRQCYSYDFQEYFQSIITRIGINSEFSFKANDDNGVQTPHPFFEPQELSLCSKAVLDLTYTISDGNLKVLDEYEWFRPMLEVTKTLFHMSKSASLDEPVILILPAVKAFWLNIQHEIHNYNIVISPSPLKNERLYSRFAELCVYTLEHLMRGESPLSNHPEVRPLAFDIPVFMFEYYNAFLLNFGKIMSQNDPANTFFLLVPSTEKPVATEELFEAENGIPGLLQITVPFSMLYKPEILLPTLCHELAHYVGEIHRLREERYKLFLKAVAIDIVNIFFKGTKEGFDSFVDFLAEDFLSETLQRSFAKTNPCDNCNKIMELPLLNIAIRIGEMVSLMRGCEAYSEPVKEYLLSSKNKNTKIIPVSPQFLNDCFNAFQRMLSEKRILFRETYADVCMLYFLDLSPEQYLIISLPNDSPINLTYLYQVYIALNVMGYSLGIIKTALENWGKVVNADKGDIEKACKELASINESINDTSTADNCLFVYITKCKESLSTSYKNRKKEYGYIKKMYNIAINSDTKYEDFLNVIDNSRKDFFERILQVD